MGVKRRPEGHVSRSVPPGGNGGTLGRKEPPAGPREAAPAQSLRRARRRRSPCPGASTRCAPTWPAPPERTRRRPGTSAPACSPSWTSRPRPSRRWWRRTPTTPGAGRLRSGRWPPARRSTPGICELVARAPENDERWARHRRLLREAGFGQRTDIRTVFDRLLAEDGVEVPPGRHRLVAGRRPRDVASGCGGGGRPGQPGVDRLPGTAPDRGPAPDRPTRRPAPGVAGGRRPEGAP